MMKSKKIKLIKEIIKELKCSIEYIIKGNIYNLGAFLEALNPYIIIFIIYKEYQARGTLVFGGELFIPIIIYIISKMLKKVANKLNVGYDIPLPYKRFTKDAGKGEVTMAQDDLQDMMLYMFELEEYLKKTGKTNE